MGRKRYTPEQIIRLLRQSEVLSSQGRNLPEICKEIGVTTNTYYRWRKEYGGMQVNQAKRLKALEEETHLLRAANQLRIKTRQSLAPVTKCFGN
jgi:putative transposase